MAIIFPASIVAKGQSKRVIAPYSAYTSALTETTQENGSSTCLYEYTFNFPPITKSNIPLLENVIAKAAGNEFLFPIYQDGINAPPAMTVTLSAAASGFSLPVTGITSTYALKTGQIISVIDGGRRFTYPLGSDSAAGSTGRTLTLASAVRRPHASGSIVEITQPYVQGSIPPESRKIDMDVAFLVGFSVTVREKR